MAKRKGPIPSKASPADSSGVPAETGIPAESRQNHPELEASELAADGLPLSTTPSAETPSPQIRRLVSLVVAVHLGGLLIALSANLAPSFLHGQIQPWLALVHVTTGQDYVMLPLELTHAARMDSPLVVELRTAGETQWRRVPLPKVRQRSRPSADLLNTEPTPLLMNRSRWPNVGRLIAWIALEQPDSEVLPEFLMQSLKYAAARNDWGEVSEVRLMQPHLLSFDEMLMVERGQAALISDDLQGEVLYSASVVRGPRGELGLVPHQEPVRTSKPIRQSNKPGQLVEDEPR